MRRSGCWIQSIGRYERWLPGFPRLTLGDATQAWFYGEGTKLPVDLEYDTSLATQAYALASKWDASRNTTVSKLTFSASDLKQFNSNQKGKHGYMACESS